MHRDLSYRRSQRDKRLKKSKKIAKLTFPYSKGIEREDAIDKWTKRNSDNLQCCSCSMCGNPRKHIKGKERLTIQERRFLEQEQDFE